MKTPPHRRLSAEEQQEKWDRAYGRHLKVSYVKLPVPHLKILQQEADLFGVSRGDFLSMLLRRKRGEISFDRPSNAPAYSFRLEEFKKQERFAWYMKHEVFQMLEQDRTRMGNIPVSAWIAFALNDWIGQPKGL